MNKGLRISLISVGAIAVAAVAITHSIRAVDVDAIAVASDLYVSCLVGFTQARGYPDAALDIQTQAKELDTLCTQWSSALLAGFHPSGKSQLTLAEHLYWWDQRRAAQAEYIETMRTLVR